MFTADGLERFYRKRGVKVRVNKGTGGFVVSTATPDLAAFVWGSVEDTTTLVFVLQKPLWKRLMFWSK